MGALGVGARPMAGLRLAVGSGGGVWLAGRRLAAGTRLRDRSRPLSSGGSAVRREPPLLARLTVRGVTARVVLACGGCWPGSSR